MNLPRGLALASLLLLLTACSKQPDDYFPGYAEGDYLRIAAPIAGTLTRLQVQRGDEVKAGAPAFALEQDSERAAREQAEFQVQRAQAQLADLEKGRRPDEVAALQAQLAQARAALNLSESNLQRQQKLVADHFISPATLDAARTAVRHDRGQLNELQAQLRLAKLGARSDQVEAAKKDLQAAKAQLEQAAWRLDQKTQRMPAAGEVADVLYRPGEFVPAGSPVLSLLPPQNIKARFFVPEALLGRLRVGEAVSLHCDGCGQPIDAHVSFIATAPEYTSPLIYSKENRATLVFMVEAKPAPQQATRLHPGQPLEVHLAKSAS